MESAVTCRGYVRTAIVAVVLAALAPVALDGQARGAGRGGPPPTAKQAAAIDLTGYWVAVITEDWKFRMVTPRKGVYELLQLNAAGRKVGDSWDPAKDEAAGEQCRGYGAGNIMRLPTRLRVSWQDDTTLRSKLMRALRRACSASARRQHLPASRRGRALQRPSGSSRQGAAPIGAATSRW
jgi:hypothetical protein